MSKRTVLLLFISIFLVSSCAAERAVAGREEELFMPPGPEEFKMPEPKAKPEPVIKEDSSRRKDILIEAGDNDKYILLNFENTNIKTVISSISKLLKTNYILTPGISGTVTIQSYKKFPLENLFQIFQNILEINGLTAVRKDDFYVIIPIDTAKQQPLDVDKGRELEFRLDASFITQIIPLEYVKAADVSNILRNFVSRGTEIIVYEPSNLLIITTLPKTLYRFMKIIESIDIPDSESETLKTFVYYVENGEAKKLEEILNSMYTDEKKAKTKAVMTYSSRAAQGRPSPKPQGSVVQPLAGELGDVSIKAYQDINALIIKCTSKAYLSLLEVLRKVDVPPKQVLIEVMIAEVSLIDEFEFGLEWLIKTGSGDIIGLNAGSEVSTAGTTAEIAVPPVIPDHPGGFAAVVSGTMSEDLFNYVFSAIAARTNVNVLANPLILAMDNQEAEIKIGSEVPTATRTSQSSEGVTTTSEIQYKTVGTILTVTPRITEKGNVSMKLVVEKSSVSQTSTTIGTGTYPRFETRRATTSAVVQDGHSLFLGGLISNKNTNTRSGIPWLSRIPILGYLFGASTKGTEKTELLVMVTPHMVRNQDEADELTRKFQNRIKTVKKKLSELEKKEKKKEVSPAPEGDAGQPTSE